jgi:hypothetical protein
VLWTLPFRKIELYVSKSIAEDSISFNPISSLVGFSTKYFRPGSTMLLTQGIIGLSLLGQGALALRLWNTTDGFSSDLPWGCQRALTRDIACQNYLVTAQDASNGAALPPSLAKEYCTQECRDSIDGFQRAAHLACGNKSYKMFANSTVRAVPGDIANGLMWAYQLNCIQDS